MLNEQETAPVLQHTPHLLEGFAGALDRAQHLHHEILEVYKGSCKVYAKERILRGPVREQAGYCDSMHDPEACQALETSTEPGVPKNAVAVWHVLCCYMGAVAHFRVLLEQAAYRCSKRQHMADKALDCWKVPLLVLWLFPGAFTMHGAQLS